MTNPAIETIKTLLDKPEYRRAIGWKAIVELADRLDKLEQAHQNEEKHLHFEHLSDNVQTQVKQGIDNAKAGKHGPFTPENVVQWKHEPPLPYLPKAFVSVAPKVDVSNTFYANQFHEIQKAIAFLQSIDLFGSQNQSQIYEKIKVAIQILKDYQGGNNGDNT